MNEKRSEELNGIQRRVISWAVPIIIILIGFTVIGSSFSTFGGIGDNPSIVFDPLQYMSRHGIEWSIVVVLISLFEIFWWKDPKNKDK